MQQLDHTAYKHTFTTHRVPLDRMVNITAVAQRPSVGDLVLAEVTVIGNHNKIEDRTGVQLQIFPGDCIIGAFGNRYATDQFEGYVPDWNVEDCDMLSIGGVIGQVASAHAIMKAPTRLRIIGSVSDAQGQRLNLRSFSVPPSEQSGRSEVILVVGAAMNAGKTTAVGTLVRALRAGGLSVAAAKVTGTAAGKDGRFFVSCGAEPVLDFIDAGYPSTYMLALEELIGIVQALTNQLRASDPDYIVLEVADGIFQRETRMLLENEQFRGQVDHVFFAATDSLSAESGVRCLRDYGLPLRAIAGMITQSPLAMREAEEITGVACLSIEQMMEGGLLARIGREPMPLIKDVAKQQQEA